MKNQVNDQKYPLWLLAVARERGRFGATRRNCFAPKVIELCAIESILIRKSTIKLLAERETRNGYYFNQ
jgi:hypothetical protein